MRKNIFLTFITACLPGFGQMYYGLMRRGLSIGFWFYALVSLAAFLRLGPLVLFLPLIWAYSFFDTFNLRALTTEQYNALTDEFLPNGLWLQMFDSEKMSQKRMRKWFGGALIILGVLFLYNTLVTNNDYWQAFMRVPIIGFVLQSVPGLLIGLVVILVGLSMLRGRKPSFVSQLDEVVFSDEPKSATQKVNTQPPFSQEQKEVEKKEAEPDELNESEQEKETAKDGEADSQKEE